MCELKFHDRRVQGMSVDWKKARKLYNKMKEVNMKYYGKEYILDLHECRGPFSRTLIENFCIELCDKIDMERGTIHFWDYAGYPEEYEAAPAHLKGVSCVQFIKTSNITIHALDEMKRVYINVFSCKNFDSDDVFLVAMKYFSGKVVHSNVIDRR